MDSSERTPASVTLVVLIACSLFLTPVGSAAGSPLQAESAIIPDPVSGQTAAGNTPTTTPAETATRTNTSTDTITPTATGTPTPTARSPTATATATQTRTPITSQSQGTIGPPTVRVVNDPVQPDEVVVITATFTNNGTTAREVNAVFRAYGEIVEQDEIQIPAGESATVRFDQRIDEPGRYLVSVNGQTATVDVVRASPTPIGDGGSGLGVGAELTMVTVTLLAGGVVLLIRWL